MKIRKYLDLLVLLLLTLAASCSPTVEVDKASLVKTELGISRLAELDYENVDHLVFLHKNASRQDIQFAEDSMQLAQRLMSKEDNLFPRIQLEEAITAYPTSEIIISFANGFLNVAQFHLLNNKDANLLTPIGNNDIKWYFEGANFYYGLAVEFATKIDQPFNIEISNKIASTMSCIHQVLVAGIFVKSNLCKGINL